MSGRVGRRTDGAALSLGLETGATAGSVLFAGAAGVLAQDNANLFWDDTNDRLGVGTATPQAGLEVTGDICNTSEIDDGDTGATQTTDWTTGNHHKSTLTANCTYTFTAPGGAAFLALRMVQGGAGGFAPTFPGTVKLAGGSFTPTAAAGSVDTIVFDFDGTNYNELSRRLDVK